MRKLQSALALGAALLFTTASHAAFLVEVDTDGLDDGILTFSPNFGFGGDTTTASQSAPSTAFGMTGGDSVFSGDGVDQPDTYVVTYDPSSEADNLAVPTGTDLGEGNKASGIAGGGAGRYAVYSTWPFTSNVSGGPTQYDTVTAGSSDSALINQNDAADLFGAAGRGHVWVKVGEVLYTSGPITVSQFPTVQNSFVSMRAAGYLFERIPEPTALAMASLAALGLAAVRRRR